MIQAFRPLKSALYTLFVVFVILFFNNNMASIFPAIFLILAIHGFESFYKADIDKIYGKNNYNKKERLALFKISLLLAIISLISAFYFGLSLWYIVLPVAAIIATSLTNTYQFASDFLISLTITGILILHSNNILSLSPIYWFVFFQELALRSIHQLSRPFGMENFNLSKILGPEAALEFVLVLVGLSIMWPLLMAQYSSGLGFFFFSFSSMLLATSIYALWVLHLEKSETIIRASTITFLISLYLMLI